MLKRIIWDIILFASIFVLPWWLFAVLVMVGAIYFTNYLEVVLLGLLMDSFYGTATAGIFGIPIIYTAYSVAALFIGIMIRRYVRW